MALCINDSADDSSLVQSLEGFLPSGQWFHVRQRLLLKVEYLAMKFQRSLNNFNHFSVFKLLYESKRYQLHGVKNTIDNCAIA